MNRTFELKLHFTENVLVFLLDKIESPCKGGTGVVDDASLQKAKMNGFV